MAILPFSGGRGIPRAVMGDFELPVEELASIRVPVVAVAGEKTTPILKRAVEEVARIVPGARHQLAPRMSHAIKPAALAPLLRDWFEGLARPATRERVPR